MTMGGKPLEQGGSTRYSTARASCPPHAGDTGCPQLPAPPQCCWCPRYVFYGVAHVLRREPEAGLVAQASLPNQLYN